MTGRRQARIEKKQIRFPSPHRDDKKEEPGLDPDRFIFFEPIEGLYANSPVV